MTSTFGADAVGGVTLVVASHEVLEGVGLELPRSVLLGYVDAAALHLATELGAVAADGALEKVAGAQRQLLHAAAVEPRLFAATGRPQDAVVGTRH